MAVGALVAGGGALALGPTSASASSHREAPRIAGLPAYDNTDVYAFVSPDDATKTTLIANWFPNSTPAGGPNFYQFATDGYYDVNIDNNGDAKADIVYRWTFSTKTMNKNTFLYNTGQVTSLTDPDLNVRQTYNLDVREHGHWSRILRNALVAPSFVGNASMPNYKALRDQAITSKGALKSFAGQADDPFFLDLRVFDLLYGGNLSEVGHDTLAGYSVNSVALQLPSSVLKAKSGDPVVGVWSTTSRRNSSGHYVQISRLGNPLVNEVVIPLKGKDKFNGSAPKRDGQFLSYVTNPILPKVVQAVYKIPAPATPRKDLVQVFLTGVPGLNMPAHLTRPGEMLRLNTSIAPSAHPNRLGVIGGDTAGFPNGRRLADDVLDISLQVVEGELVGSPNDLGDAVNTNDKAFGTSFPYLALPTSGSSTTVDMAGYTVLTGGNAPDSASGVPAALPAGLLGLGALSFLVGLVGLARRRTTAIPVTA